jgi:hypothetical protein
MRVKLRDLEEVPELARGLRPNFDNEPTWEKAALVLSLLQAGNVTPRVAAEFLSQLIPEQREFWLRVTATVEERFYGGLLAMFTMEDCDDEPEDQ